MHTGFITKLRMSNLLGLTLLQSLSSGGGRWYFTSTRCTYYILDRYYYCSIVQLFIHVLPIENYSGRKNRSPHDEAGMKTLDPKQWTDAYSRLSQMKKKSEAFWQRMSGQRKADYVSWREPTCSLSSNIMHILPTTTLPPTPHLFYYSTICT